MRDLIGQKVAGYPIEKPMGQGAYTTTWQVQSAAAPLAVMLLCEDFGAENAYSKSIVLGWDTVRSVHHANLMLMYGTGVDAVCGAYCLEEMVQGKTLRDFIVQGAKVSWRDSLVLFEQVLSALNALHEAKSCHGSLCPSNFFLTQDQDVKLEGAGGLLYIDRPLEELSQTGLVLNSALSYFAPERLYGFKPTPTSDLYSAGACLYFILTGQDLFNGEDAAAVLRGIKERQPPSISAWRDDIPASGLEWGTRLLAKDLSQRYQTCEAVLADLVRLKADQPLAPLKSVARTSSSLGQVPSSFSAGASSVGNNAARSQPRISAIGPSVKASGLQTKVASGLHSKIASGLQPTSSSGIVPVVSRSNTGIKLFGQLATHVKSTIPQSDLEKKGDECFHQQQLPLALKYWHEAVYIAPHTALNAKIELAELETKKEGYALSFQEAENRMTLGDSAGALQYAHEALDKAASDIQRQNAQKLLKQVEAEIARSQKSQRIKMGVGVAGIVIVLIVLYVIFRWA